jgi:hypothetical protein
MLEHQDFGMDDGDLCRQCLETFALARSRFFGFVFRARTATLWILVFLNKSISRHLDLNFVRTQFMQMMLPIYVLRKFFPRLFFRFLLCYLFFPPKNILTTSAATTENLCNNKIGKLRQKMKVFFLAMCAVLYYVDV